MDLEVGVSLPVFLARATARPAELPGLARHAESIGLDAVWSGDHLTTGAPLVESTVTLSAAAAVTERIRLGFGALVLGLRQPAWAAKQIASLQLISGDRVLLGVGIGGEFPPDFAAAGVPMTGRGRRTDTLLESLPGLLGGEPTRLATVPGEPVVTLAPAVPMPPVWIGGMSEAALRRAVRFGHGWLGSMRSPGQLAGLTGRLTELAEEAQVAAPAAGMIVFAGGEGFVRYLIRTYGLTPEQAGEIVVSDAPEPLAARMRDYADAGANHLLIATTGLDTRAEYDRVAEAKALLGIG